ncbi:MAG: ParB N-terminal domain-containing protein [bacterium]|nr:ParB N-terminal domain-containing protein [bacterium]
MPAIEVSTQPVHLEDLGDRLSALRLRRPEADERMRRSLDGRGQLTAVKAFDDGDVLQLVDGFKRLRAAGRLGWSCLRVRVLELDEATATAVIGALHEHRGLTELEEGWIVRSLCREHGLSQGAVARLMNRHKSWVSRRLLLIEGLDQVVQANVRLGLLSPRSALAVAALPRGNQPQAAELVMGRGMTTRQAEALVRRLRELDSDEQRARRMTQWPEPSASTASGAGRARPRSDSELLLADVSTLMRVAVRLEVRLLERPIRVDGPEIVREALGDLAALLDTLEMAIARALALQDKVDATLAQP